MWNACPRSACRQRAVIQQTKLHNASHNTGHQAQVAQCNLCVAKCQGLARLTRADWAGGGGGGRVGFIRRCSANDALDEFRTRNVGVTRQRRIRTTPWLFPSSCAKPFLSFYLIGSAFKKVKTPRTAPRKCTSCRARDWSLASRGAQGNESEFRTCRALAWRTRLRETNKRGRCVL